MIKVLKFISSYFWIILLSITMLSILFNYIFFRTEGVLSIYCWFKGVSYIDNTNLVTISTVLIGIYFSLYTYILSVDSNSFISEVNKKEFKRLIRMINRGFISSLLIVLLSFVNNELFTLLSYWYILILFLLFIVVIGSLLEIGLFYTMIFKKDLDARYEQFDKSRIEDENNRRVNEKLMDFLERQNYD
ncbi:hypothetical protein [Vagococcus fluvialis]|uniref:hypothetical protein n=1 Tax=Vagococcus fluvialis TaxID=2738 RepID=UPI001D0B25A9|nr:hypothetical protein [Vagococcus fluvialis]UDM73272.1 hypothetical protein K5K99_10075 [Vagococcus fluvialis]